VLEDTETQKSSSFSGSYNYTVGKECRNTAVSSRSLQLQGPYVQGNAFMAMGIPALEIEAGSLEKVNCRIIKGFCIARADTMPA
jgi:hypothetical protein